MSIKAILAVPFAVLTLVLAQVPATGGTLPLVAHALTAAPAESKPVTVAYGRRQFNRCMARCNMQGYNTRLCPSKCGSL